MSEQSFLQKLAHGRLFQFFPRLAGGAVALFGILIVISWYAHWRPILQMVPETAPMQYNTALCFILCGAGLFFRNPKRAQVAPWFGAIVAVFTLLTLLQYITGHNLGIDTFFHNPYFQVPATYRGRMSPLTAVCFICIGTGLFLTGYKTGWQQRFTASGLLACVVAVISLVALFGYVFGVNAAYGWGAYSRMAANTAVMFILLGTGLLLWSWQKARAENFNFLRWLPVTGSVTLMMMIAFVTITNMVELKKATYWRKHTTEVILSGEVLEENLIDLQRGMRGYITLGDTNALASYVTNVGLEAQQLSQLKTLTRDNPGQQKKLQVLAAAMNDVLFYDRDMIELSRRLGAAAALKTDTNGVGRAVFGNARDILKSFTKEEQRLLTLRGATEEADASNAERLLVFGSVLAAILLVFANYMASRELRNRRNAEFKLREVTALQNAILSSANYAVIALDAKGVVQTFNPAAERLLGYTAGEVIGRTTPMLWRDPAEVAAEAERLSRELKQPVKPGIDIILAQNIPNKVVESEVTYIRKDGGRLSVLVSRTPMLDNAGKITGILGVMADITERKKSEAAMRESEARFRSAFDNAPIGMALVSPTGRWLRVNRAINEMLGYTEVELLATDFQHITHPADLMQDLGLVLQMLAGTLPSYRMEKRYLHKNGSLVNAMLSVSLVRDQAGEPLYFVSQLENITERKLQEAEREKLITELRAALADIKTLSGLIPICAWCKSVRSDKGYWQSVEQYVRANTDATFSHGMCPTCNDKFTNDMLKETVDPALQAKKAD